MNNVSTFSLTPTNLQEAMQMADLMAGSEMVPKDYQGKPGNVLVAVQMGAELGLKPVQALQNIAVVNGRPSVWGDGLRALVMSAPDLVGIEDTFDTQSMTARCVIKRKINGNVVEFIGEFSQADAQAAGLWGRNTWKSYPKKMLEWRAFGYAARKAYADRLRGIQLAEEMQDVQPQAQPERDITPEAKVVEAKSTYPQDRFESSLPKWKQAVAANKKTPKQIIEMVEVQFTLSDEQRTAIENLNAIDGEAA
ncbi:hypothetical protein TW81_02100 [Vibrio galatheae]|uniref:Recombinase RecT n=1 Tax=Vibrio galatheae TaxID=579748 RepID=A0A0F4NNR7_9VIBR|nr:hypothetical protein [Vibrio galatheae]KJY84810.1 hypothetical protein TW81_02100 [Vibrio galatheae]